MTRWLLAVFCALCFGTASAADGPVIGASGELRLMWQNVATVGARPSVDLQFYGRQEATLELTRSLALVGKVRLEPIAGENPGDVRALRGEGFVAEELYAQWMNDTVWLR